MIDNAELKRLAEAVEDSTSMDVADEAAWMRRTTGEKVLELFEELENIKADRKACWEEFKVQGRLLDQLKAENEALLEMIAREIYERWSVVPGYVPWVRRGNSLKQDEARRLARAAMSKEPKA